VRCTLGGAFDVAVDIRAGSPTFGRWASFELTDENMLQVWVPPGFAHGFQALSDPTDIQYLATGFYTPDAEHGIAWNDPALGITWPLSRPSLSERDRRNHSWRDYVRAPAFTYPLRA